MIEIWDCSGAQDFPDANGQGVSAAGLVGLARQRSSHSGVAGDWIAPPDAILDFHPLAARRVARWERALATAVLALSGQTPTRDELVHGREVLDRLPSAVRRSLEPEDILRTLAPLLIGFRLSRGADHVKEANRHHDMSRVMARLLDARPIMIDIPLCAHRESPAIAPLGLAAAPSRRAVSQVCALLRTILANSRAGPSTVRFRQQEPSERASACMFPSLFAAHMERGRTEQLLVRLEQHRQALARLIRPFDGSGVRFEVLGLDAWSRQAEDDLAAAYGANWTRIEVAQARASLPGALASAAFDSALDHVTRLMPEVGGPVDRPPNTRPDAGGPAHAAEQWFRERSSMTPAARALFEIAFHRAWGRTACLNGSLGLGFDRDFAAFQRHAWQLAFEVDREESVPLLYARRSTTTYPGGGLRNLSFRQFWVDGAIDSADVAA